MNSLHPSAAPVPIPIDFLGDILASTRPVIMDARSLNNSDDTVTDSIGSVPELNTFEATLKIIDQRMGLQPQQYQIVAARIDDIARRCRSDIESFRNNVRSYHEGRSGVHKKLWEIWKNDEVTRFRGKLARYQVELSVCLQFAVLSVLLSLMQKQEC